VLATQKRAMSTALLVPLEQKETMPFELRSTDLTDAEFEKAEIEYKEFNAKCSEELKEMNQNRITNIIERGGVEGWETVCTFTLSIFILGCRSRLPQEKLHLQDLVAGAVLHSASGYFLLAEGASPRMVSDRWRQDSERHVDESLRQQQSHALRFPAR